MSRAKRIVRLTFWLNNMTLGYLGLMLVARQLPLLVILGVTSLFVGGIMTGSYVLHHRLGVTTRQGLYFVDDEREKAIALRVHATCMRVLMSGTYGIMLLTLTLMNGLIQRVYLFGLMLVGALLGLMFLTNCQYYYLWWKYDQD